jgi:hypothetical protein
VLHFYFSLEGDMWDTRVGRHGFQIPLSLPFHMVLHKSFNLPDLISHGYRNGQSVAENTQGRGGGMKMT